MSATPSAGPASLQGCRIVLGVCGGVAAYKAVEVCRRLVGLGAHVAPVLTANATRFIGAATFAAVASEPPRLDLWQAPEPSPHTTLGQSADLIVVAPATARLLAAYAVGLSDDLLTATLLATRAPVLLAPAMHTEMWEHAAVQANLAVLRSRNVLVIDPESGELAGGDVGLGRLAEPATIVDAVIAALVDGSRHAGGSAQSAPSALARRTVLVTAGGTREPIDPVRYLGNRSSGRQGHALAEVAVEQGARVVLITASLEPVPKGVEVVHQVATAEEMCAAVLRELPSADLVVMAAAVADFRPAAPHDQKWKRTEGPPAITLVPTTDILAEVVRRRTPGQVIVGFAAETDDLEARATAKLESKGLDVIVANDVTAEGAGFEHATNDVVILTRTGGRFTTGLADKRTVAASVLSLSADLLIHVGAAADVRPGAAP